MPRRKWITIVHPANVRWSSHSNSFVHTRSIAATRRIMIRFCVSLNEIMTSAVGERGNLFHHDVAGLPCPLHNEMLCDLWPREREDSRNSLSSAERSFFYQIFSIKHIDPLRSWRIAFTAHFYDLCWKVESFIVCLPVGGYKSLVLGEEDLSGREFVPARCQHSLKVAPGRSQIETRHNNAVN